MLAFVLGFIRENSKKCVHPKENQFLKAGNEPKTFSRGKNKAKMTFLMFKTHNFKRKLDFLDILAERWSKIT